MYINAGRISIFISPAFAVFLALCPYFTAGRMYFMSFLCAFMHEAVHIVCLFVFGSSKVSMELYPGGIKLSAVGFSSLSYKRTVICAMSAPLFNVLCAGVWLLAESFLVNGFCREMLYINLIMGAVNLIPLPFLDGGRAASSVLYFFLEPERARAVCDTVAVTALILLAFIIFLILIKEGFYFMWLIFFVYCTLGCIRHKRNDGVS